MPSHITIKISGTTRCPGCNETRIVIERFDHSPFMFCYSCNMSYEVIDVSDPGVTIPEYIPGNVISHA